MSRFDIEGVERASHGVSRRISIPGLHRIALARQLVTRVGIGIRTAVDLADRLLTSSDGCVELSPGLEIRFDRPAFVRSVELAVADAVETVVPARRGRPRRRTETGHG